MDTMLVILYWFKYDPNILCVYMSKYNVQFHHVWMWPFIACLSDTSFKYVYNAATEMSEPLRKQKPFDMAHKQRFAKIGQCMVSSILKRT